MPFKHYIQKLEGRLPEYTATQSKRVWEVSRRQHSLLYFSTTLEVLEKYVEIDFTTSSRWLKAFSWSIADEILYRNLGGHHDCSQWWRKNFYDLSPEYQDFILAVKNKELHIND